MLLAAFGIVLVADAFFLMPQPNIGPMFVEPPGSWVGLIPAAGFVVQALGLAWMIRIYRSDPEAHPSHWRFDRL